ncbi:calcineurin-like phosphoesterase C-terminal domain-containing protein [Sphingobacterium haloxyli]|uniref:Metallophosphoesterase n=1 Tax=Sphingobacterium haloxyli TaxID=2100533 RepID=A0A2S9J597_9SPHI|nr:calcineurin-like phosphoesterase C-terminal domain-containing protein [Sphingobacterium haloxyli]PRD47951.1 hypothetical protein C5745_08595 [Sphingobacterium haloxyli]
MNLKIALLTGVLFSNVLHAQEMIRGLVYEDVNQNGKKERREKGLPQVAVSNGVDVVLTDQSGAYQLPVRDNSIFFVVKPNGYQFPLDENNMPEFYYIHKPQGSPDLKYKGSEPTGKLPKSLDFALLKDETEKEQFSALVFGDPQAYNMDEIAYFDEGIVQEISNREKFAFGLSLGDLVGDDLTLHDPYKKTVGKLGLPWFNVMGNHDMNYDVQQDVLSDETYQKNFGPNNFSFNYGGAHFIVLDNIIYPNPRTGKGYLGGFRKDQLDFVENNLKFVPKDKLVVLAFHIPLLHDNSDVFRNEDRQRLFDLLAEYPNTLSLSAHTHLQRHNFYTKEDGWKQDKPHHEYNVGTTSGDWYSGLKNKLGVPTSTMRDGTPKGYAILNIEGNKYTFDYKVAGEPEDYRLNIIFPAAVQQKYLRRHTLSVNFFIGASSDIVEYSLDGKEWKKMNHTETEDPSFQYHVLKFDNAETMMDGRRPSNAVKSTHVWQAKLPGKLQAGQYTIQVRATDMFGRTHLQTKDLKIVE